MGCMASVVATIELDLFMCHQQVSEECLLLAQSSVPFFVVAVNAPVQAGNGWDTLEQ